MFFRLVADSFGRRPRHKLLTGAALALGMGVATATLSVALEVGDRLAKEFRSLGANLVVTPKADSLPLEIGGVDYRPVKDRKSTRLNSSHSQISYAVFCLKKKHNSHRSDVAPDAERLAAETPRPRVTPRPTPPRPHRRSLPMRRPIDPDNSCRAAHRYWPS